MKNFYTSLFVGIFMIQMAWTQEEQAQSSKIIFDINSMNLTVEKIQASLRDHGVVYDQLLQFKESDLPHSLNVKEVFDGWYISFEDQSSLVTGGIAVYKDIDECHKAFVDSPNYGSNSMNLMVENFRFSQVGDVLFTRFDDRLFLCRGNIYVNIRVNGASITPEQRESLYKLAYEIDRKVCEVNGLPIPPFVEEKDLVRPVCFSEAQLKALDEQSDQNKKIPEKHTPTVLPVDEKISSKISTVNPELESKSAPSDSKGLLYGLVVLILSGLVFFFLKKRNSSSK